MQRWSQSPASGSSSSSSSSSGSGSGSGPAPSSPFSSAISAAAPSVPLAAAAFFFAARAARRAAAAAFFSSFARFFSSASAAAVSAPPPAPGLYRPRQDVDCTARTALPRAGNLDVCACILLGCVLCACLYVRVRVRFARARACVQISPRPPPSRNVDGALRAPQTRKGRLPRTNSPTPATGRVSALGSVLNRLFAQRPPKLVVRVARAGHRQGHKGGAAALGSPSLSIQRRPGSVLNHPGRRRCAGDCREGTGAGGAGARLVSGDDPAIGRLLQLHAPRRVLALLAWGDRGSDPRCKALLHPSAEASKNPQSENFSSSSKRSHHFLLRKNSCLVKHEFLRSKTCHRPSLCIAVRYGHNVSNVFFVARFLKSVEASTGGCNKALRPLPGQRAAIRSVT